MLEDLFKLLDRHWLVEQITLESMAAVQIEKLALRFGFHPLGDHIQTERQPHRNNGMHDGSIVGVSGKIADERLVDLQLIQRQLLKVGKR